MAAPFATVDDLVGRGRVVPDAQKPRALQALIDASNTLRGEIGWQVYPTVTLTTQKNDLTAAIRLHGSPVRAVVSVTDGVTSLPTGSYRLVDDVVLLDQPARRAFVTYTVGYDTPPPELVAWTCVLAADELDRADMEGVSAVGATPASIAIDDFRVGYSTRQQAGDSLVPDRVLTRLRTTYGSGGGAYVL